VPELPVLDGLSELPGLDIEGGPDSDALAGAASSLATAWRGGPQQVYGCTPAELDRLIKGVLGGDAPGSAAQAPVWSADQLALRADFGPPPDGRVAAIGYAVRVLQRRRALREEAAAAQRAAVDARAQGRGALAELGEAIFARRAEAGRGSLAQRIEMVMKALSMVEERERAQVELGEHAAEQFAHHEAAIASAEDAAEPHRTRCVAIEQQVARARREVERASALHKRAEIEIRAAQSATAPDAARIERAQADRKARAAELARTESALAAVQVQLADGQAELARHVAEVDSHRRALQAAVAEQAQQAGAAQSALGDAAASRRDALCELASMALLQNLAPRAQAEVTVEALRRASAATDETALVSAAISAHDEDGFRAGVTTAAIAAAAVMVLLVWLAV
jgi:hypothetical protein